MYSSIMDKVHEAFLLVRKPPRNVVISLTPRDERILLRELGVYQDVKLEELGGVEVCGTLEGKKSAVYAQDERGRMIFERFI